MKVQVQVLKDFGLVWNSDGVVELRLQHRIVGSMIGSIEAFKQQNNIRGLPLRLSPLEVGVLVSQGCVELYCLDQSSDLVSLPSIDHGDESSDDGSLCELWSGIDIPPWKAALASKSELYVHDVSSASVRHPVSWTFPTTLQEQQRHAVFSDLYFKRYFLTDGIKFGGDFLAYERDPETCHAAFTVLVVPGGQLNDDELGSACRAATAARKRLLVANPVLSNGDWTVEYTTVYFASQKQL